MNSEHAERARGALRMAESDPRRAVALAERAYRAATADRDTAAASMARRAWGYAAFHLHDTEVALRHLRAAVRLGRAAGSDQLAAEARMALAGVLTWRGRGAQALREIGAALSGLGGVEHARALAQKGAILQMLGRGDEALACYRGALPALRRARDQVWVQRVLLNRGVLQAQRRDYRAAQEDLGAAQRVCEELDLDLSLGFVQQNLGFVSGRLGDVPAALTYLDSAEARFRALGSQLGPVLSDRAELLLSVRLIAEARAAAEQAVAAFEREGRGVALPEARLLLARAALLDGDLLTAQRQARRAQREFTAHGKADWAAFAQLTVLRCRQDLAAATGGRRPDTRALGAIAELLARSWPDAALDALLLATTAALPTAALEPKARATGSAAATEPTAAAEPAAAAGPAVAAGRRAATGRAKAAAAAMLAEASRHRGRGVATLRARGWYAEALRLQLAGDEAGALRSARAGLRILDEHVAALGATDLRAHAAGHRTELADLGLRIALRDGRPHLVFGWAELGRASHLTHRPVRPPADVVLADALAELRAITAELDQQRRDGQPSSRLLHRQAVLEREIRDHHRRQRGRAAATASAVTPGAATPAAFAAPTVSAVARALGDAALVEFVQHDSTLLAVSVVGGRARLHTLGRVEAVTEGSDALSFALRQLTRANLRPASRDAAQRLLLRTADDLDRLLLRPVPGLGDRSLVLVPTGPLQSLPWSVLPSCRGRPVTVTPSAGLWLLASRAPTADGTVLVAAGPDLPGAAAEAEAVAAVHGATAISGPEATVGAITSALDGASLAHLATHGRVRADNPLFSALRFADGPLMAHDLEALRRTPETVVLAACDTGQPVVRTGDEVMGLGATLLTRGARRFVAPVLAVLDAETAPLMVAFHKLLAAGQPPAHALATAQQHTAADHPAGLAAVAPFVCLGAGL